MNLPLSEQLRPGNLNEVIGQNKIIGENTTLRQMIETDNYSSFILWGSTGCGKTTIVKIIEKTTKYKFYFFSAVIASIKDVKAVLKDALTNLKEKGEKSIVFVDEIHRFNKLQQDSFLFYIEEGIVFIGATTENPSFNIINPLLSRCMLFVLNKLSDEDIKNIILQSIKKANISRKINDTIIELLVSLSNSDGRKAINNLEIIVNNTTESEEITKETVEKILTKKIPYYDKNGDNHYDLISALHKSIRGSDLNAGLYYLARMLNAGEDPLYIVRRLIRIAAEDVGLAEPNALNLAISVKSAVEFLGIPECNLHLAQLVIYLATCPKSNSVYTAYSKAKEDAEKTPDLDIPLYLKNASSKVAKELNHGKNYKYPFNFKYNYCYQKYFPDKMPEKIYYNPSQFGYEKEIQKRIDFFNKLKGN